MWLGWNELIKKSYDDATSKYLDGKKDAHSRVKVLCMEFVCVDDNDYVFHRTRKMSARAYIKKKMESDCTNGACQPACK